MVSFFTFKEEISPVIYDDCGVFLSKIPATKSVMGAIETYLRDISKLPRDSCKYPVSVGPIEPPIEAMVITVATETAISLGLMPLIWNGTIYSRGKNPHANPFVKDIRISQL